MARPHDRGHRLPPPAELEEGEVWVPNLFDLPRAHNLSARERNRLFLNQGRRFREATGVSGAASRGDGRSVVAADFDRDGQLELVVRQVSGGALLLYEPREKETGKSWVTIALESELGNRLGVGSRVTVRAGGSSQTRVLWPANSYRSSTPLELHFGLGEAEKVEEIEVRWPDGTVENFEAREAKQHLRLRRGDGVER